MGQQDRREQNIRAEAESGGGDKSVWFPADFGSNNLTYRIRNIAAVGNNNFNMRVPEDFGTLTKLVAILAPVSSFGPGTIDIESNYGTDGEADSNHNDTDQITGFSATADVFSELDLMGAVPSLAAGDNVGINIDHITGVGVNVRYYGISMEYSAP